MKKLLLVCAMFLSFTALFAQNDDSKKLEVVTAASPFSFQKVNYNGSDYPSVSSKYGFGLKEEARYFYNQNLFLGLDTSLEIFNLGDSFKTLYVNLKIMPEIGYKYALNENLYLFADAGFGLVFGYYDATLKLYPGTKAALGTGYAINEKVSLEAMLEAGIHWQPHSNSDLSAVVYNVNTLVGVTVKL